MTRHTSRGSVSVNNVICGPCAWRPAAAMTVAANIAPAIAQGDSTQARNRRGTQANSPAATAATAVPGVPLTQ
jgi:hypothetical protein